MMPVSFNLTLLNPSSLHSQLLSVFYDLSLSDSKILDDDKSLLSDCLSLNFQHAKLLWPHFGTIKVTLKTNDESLQCSKINISNIEIKISVVLKHLNSIIPRED